MRSTGSSMVSLTTGRSCSTTTGGGLKTDPAEHPDPAQSDSLVELHRWLDARSRSIRLADLLIEVENDLGFSVHFQRPGARVDPGEVCAASRDPRPRLQSRPVHHGEGRTRDRLQEAEVRQRLARLVEENQRAALAGIVHGISRLDAAGHIGATARRQPATGNASPCRTRCCSEPSAHASTACTGCSRAAGPGAAYRTPTRRTSTAEPVAA